MILHFHIHKTSKYNDDSAIPLASVNSKWGSLSAGAYCWYDNDAANKTPGRIYAINIS